MTQLETASRMKMQHLRRGEEHVMWLTSMEIPRSCILLYGNAEARPFNVATTPVLNFTEGSVVGNLGSKPRLAGQQPETMATSSSSSTTVKTGVSDSKWRRIKRENSLRKGIHLYNKVIISGPADYIVLTESDVRESGSGAADRLQLAKMFGLERYVGCLRQSVFEPGTILVKEGHKLNSLYLIIEGECRASIARDDTVSPSIIQSSEVNPNNYKPALTTAEAQLRHTRKFRWSDDSQLPVASLGPKSTVGDISLMLGIPEPTTVRAVTTVNVLTLSQEDFNRENSDRHDPTVAACIEKMQNTAYDTLRFVLERVEIESKNEHCDQRLKIDSLQEVLRQKQSDSHSKTSSSIGGSQSGLTVVHHQSDSNAGEQMPKPVSLPSVVLKHADTRRQYVASEDVVYQESPTRMTRQQRKAAQAFANLQHPVAGKSLGDCVQLPPNVQIEDLPGTDQSSQMNPQPDDELLFLFPTMTKRRQLHGMNLPLLPSYRGYDP
ncbi:hypothetical protein P3T76_011260 [Phytophthora citrophthora]|uniref:Cyclic nucleotide-binding domain-containing protein n=1 Tax=Phytophthora citrophthora TaxID=4793 RepID=A0AAD9GA88_9STRA|nr:hypothetical protein P3T76_011260 [Phytophthora citrophthora]